MVDPVARWARDQRSAGPMLALGRRTGQGIKYQLVVH